MKTISSNSEPPMRPAHLVTASLTALLIAFSSGCAKKPANEASVMSDASATATPPKSDATPSADALKSLTAEQQAAVRVMIRDTLIENPEILLEAQRAFESKQARAQNEKVAQAFTTLKREHADLSFGPSNAKITVIEFFDYKCAYCHAANDWVWNLMETRNDVRVIFKELPILSENSHGAAKAAIAAHKQGKYKEFHRALMTARGDLGMDQVMQIASTVGLDVAKLRTDMANPKIEEHVAGMRAQATQLGINGTPGFVINGKLVSGFSKDQLEAAMGTAGLDVPPPAAAPSSKG
jgi:protein-disulfide isomerase